MKKLFLMLIFLLFFSCDRENYIIDATSCNQYFFYDVFYTSTDFSYSAGKGVIYNATRDLYDLLIDYGCYCPKIDPDTYNCICCKGE